MTLNEQQAEYSGVAAYHAAGRKGAGIRVVNCESVSGAHGRQTTETLRAVAPEADIRNCSVSSAVTASGATLRFLYEGEGYTPEEFYEAVHPDIMTASLGGRKPKPELAALIQPLLERGVVFFNCVGNTMDDANYGFFLGCALSIGAAGWQNQDYSQVVVKGYSMPNPDFVAFEGGQYHGTSFSAPFAAGMAALLMQDRGRMNQEEVKELFARYAEPIDDVERCGCGLLVLPPLKGGSDVFDDVDKGRWSYEAIRWCAGRGLMQGYPDGSFKPEEPVTREQLAVILQRLGEGK